MKAIKNFTLHGANGLKVLETHFLDWLQTHKFEELGGTIAAYSWTVDGQNIQVPIDTSRLTWRLLPDQSGFICFERGYVPNNCTLLDAFGKQRMRLTVPWQLTKGRDTASNAAPSCFVGISAPYANPVDGNEGKFGVKAWVEYAGEYYFELNWHTGEFLWGKEIRF